MGEARLTVGRLLDQWLEQQRRSNKAANTIAQYQWAIDGLLKPALGRIRLVQLTAEDVENLLIARADAGTARNGMVRIRSVLAMAIDQTWARDKVARNVPRLATTPDGTQT